MVLFKGTPLFVPNLSVLSEPKCNVGLFIGFDTLSYNSKYLILHTFYGSPEKTKKNSQ